MQFNVAQLLKEPVGSTRRYQLDEDVQGLDPDLEFLSPLVGTLQMMRTNSGVLMTGTLRSAVRVTCNRCIEPIVMPLQIPVEESFRPLTEVETGRYIRPEEFEGDANDLEDESLIINEHHLLDAAEVIRQNIWLNLPMYPSCNWTGSGQCPNLAAQQAAMTEENGAWEEDDDLIPEGVDPRWAALLKLQKSANQKAAGEES